MENDAPKVVRQQIKFLIAVIIVAGAIAFLAGFGLGLLDEKTVSTVKDALNAAVEAIIAILVSLAGITLKGRLNPTH